VGWAPLWVGEAGILVALTIAALSAPEGVTTGSVGRGEETPTRDEKAGPDAAGGR